MRSTLRRNAMATPASVHCVSRQLMFINLSRTGFRRVICTFGTMSSSPSASSRIGSCAPPGTSGSRAPPGTSGFCAPPGASGFSGLTGSDPAGKLLILNLQTMASHQSYFLLVSRKCCTRCFLCTQLYNLGIENLSTPSGPKYQLSLQHSNLCGTYNLCHHTTQ